MEKVKMLRTSGAGGAYAAAGHQLHPCRGQPLADGFLHGQGAIQLPGE